ncbi:MAG TPA: hypothetical protein VKR30_01735 [Candidatus Limnocylindrales bacterium]|nr:hypothetical protein [Candidatus Limnocylindrales bacterium]
MAIDVGASKSRRSILAGALGGLGALAASALSRPLSVDAAANGNVQLGHGTADTDNDSSAETRVNGTTDGIVALSAWQNGSGTGFEGLTQTGTGVLGIAGTSGVGVQGQSDTGTGVHGESTDNTPTPDFTVPSNKTGAIGSTGATTNIAANTDELGVYGYADLSVNSVGVLGHSHQGVGQVGIGSVGVIGAGSWGVLGDVGATDVGVYGNTGPSVAPSPGTGIGVAARAESTAQVALKVIGRAQFSRSGRTYVAAGTSTRKITMSGVTTSSYIIATPQTNRAGVFVQAVVPAAGSFTIYLNKIVAGTTYVGYLVIN